MLCAQYNKIETRGADEASVGFLPRIKLNIRRARKYLYSYKNTPFKSSLVLSFKKEQQIPNTKLTSKAYPITEGGGNMKEISISCSALIGSPTIAMKAQSVLATAAIPASVIKQETPRGCVHGIRFSCSQINNVKSVLSRERIRVKQWNEAD